MLSGTRPVTTGVRARRLPAFGLLAVALALGAALIAACSGDDGVTSPPDFWADIAAGIASSDGTWDPAEMISHEVRLDPDDVFILEQAFSTEVGSPIGAYAVEPGTEVGRTNRIWNRETWLLPIEVTVGATWTTASVVGLDDYHLIRLWAPTEDEEAVVILDGEESPLIPFSVGSAHPNDSTAHVVDGALYLEVASDGRTRCYRGSPAEVTLIFEGRDCDVSKSGYILGVKGAEPAYETSVRSPAGQMLYHRRLPSRPTLSENGRYLVWSDGGDVRIESVVNPNHSWAIEGSVWSHGFREYQMASHPDGHLALAIHTPDKRLQFTGISAEGELRVLSDLECGSVSARFSEDGNLWWIDAIRDSTRLSEEACEGTLVSGNLNAWRPATGEKWSLHAAHGLRLVAVSDDSAFTLVQDEFGALLEQWWVDGSRKQVVDLEGVTDEPWQVTLRGDYLHAVGDEMVAILPLGDGEPVVSTGWCSPSVKWANDEAMVIRSEDSDYRPLLVKIDANAEKPMVFQIPRRSDGYRRYLSDIWIAEGVVWVELASESQKAGLPAGIARMSLQYGKHLGFRDEYENFGISKKIRTLEGTHIASRMGAVSENYERPEVSSPGPSHCDSDKPVRW